MSDLTTATAPAATRRDDLAVPTAMRWRPLRAGLQNVWQYDHTTRFMFHAGRLLLRGRNGVGKTKVVEVLLPFLLEGRMQPSRLDPFGTRSRKMHYNVLHEGNADHQSAIAYVWLEFGRVGDDGAPEYATIGAGLRARRTSDAVESWFFTTSARRVDRDLDLVDASREMLSRPALVEALGDEGQVLTTATDYRAAVNRLLFGVPAPQYEAMVDALLRLRQPHLSERLEPTEVGTVLSDSLPPLDTDKVTEVAEGFERLEAHRRDLEDRHRSLAAVSSFLDVYAAYAQVVVAVRARDLTRAEYRRESAASSVVAAAAAHEQAVAERDALAERATQVDTGLTAARTRIETLTTSDAYQAVERLVAAEEAQTAGRSLVESTTLRRDTSREDLATVAADADDARASLEGRVLAALQARRAASRAAGDADLVDEHLGGPGAVATLVDESATGMDALDLADELSSGRGAREAVLTQRRRAIATVRAANVVVLDAVGVVGRAEQRSAAAEDDVVMADEAAAAARAAAEAALEAFVDAVAAWAASAAQAQLGDDDVAAVLEVEPDQAPVEARRRTAAVRDRLDRAVADARTVVADLVSRRDEVIAERDALSAATHEPPASPAWRTGDRTDREGAPLYLLAEFTDALAPHEQANVEAALAASGLLDAWVLPDGTFLDVEVRDLVAVVGSSSSGRTLADVARATPLPGMMDDTVPDLLARIGLRDEGTDPYEMFPDSATAFVTTSGQFAIGPLHGRATGDHVRFLGAGAREAQRQRRLAELDAELERLGRVVVEAEEQVTAAVTARQQLEDDLAAFPATGELVASRADERTTAQRLTVARTARDEATRHRDAADRALEDARARRDHTATEVGLAAHVDRLLELDALTTTWAEHASALLVAVERWGESRVRASRAALAEERAATRVAVDEASLRDVREAQDEIDARVATLSEMIGSGRNELLASLAAAKADRKRLAGEQQEVADQRQGVAEEIGVTRTALAAAEEERDRTVEARDTATTAFVDVARLGLLDHLDDAAGTIDDEPDDWGVTAAIESARVVGRLGPELPDDEEAIRERLEREENTMARRQQELGRDLVAGIRLLPRRTHQVLVYDVVESGRTSRLGQLAATLAQEVTEREERLRGDEQELLESFLTGELHEHLRARIRDAGQLVDVMNDQLARCATTAGHRVRLKWGVGEDAPPGTGEAIELLLRGRSLITDDQRRDLGMFLHERLREAREGEAAASLFERIAGAFDYRRWYAFTVEVREASGQTWKRLTRQSHGAGSGGEKAMMLHLPLFAAMAAHYHGSPGSPRLIVLDEVFAGIDRETRGQLMGLLVELDLDALLTSHDEWGFYAELDGLSTYHLIRDPSVQGVLGEWFTWDGSVRREMGT